MPYKDPLQRKEYQRKWCAARRAAYIAGKVCAMCGGDRSLEFHHRNPDEKISHRIWSWSTVRLEAELAKCDVLCRSCHFDWHRITGTGSYWAARIAA